MRLFDYTPRGAVTFNTSYILSGEYTNYQGLVRQGKLVRVCVRAATKSEWPTNRSLCLLVCVISAPHSTEGGLLLWVKSIIWSGPDPNYLFIKILFL